jgi:hypothetical protein
MSLEEWWWPHLAFEEGKDIYPPSLLNLSALCSEIHFRQDKRSVNRQVGNHSSNKICKTDMVQSENRGAEQGDRCLSSCNTGCGFQRCHRKSLADSVVEAEDKIPRSSEELQLVSISHGWTMTIWSNKEQVLVPQPRVENELGLASASLPSGKLRSLPYRNSSANSKLVLDCSSAELVSYNTGLKGWMKSFEIGSKFFSWFIQTLS